MTLKEYVDGLNKFAKENPELIDMQVVTSKDSEGNGFNLVCYSPSKGIFDGVEFISSDKYAEWNCSESETNCVCVN